MRSFLFSTVLIAASVYVILLGWLYFAQRSILYLPDPTRHTPAEAGFPDMEVVRFQTPDKLELESWYQKAAPGRPTILYFHGNAGNLLNHSVIAGPLIREGFGVLLLEYRGYGGNPGKPTEEGLYNDARGALAFLKSQGLKNSEIVLYGMSLGTGVAVKMAGEISPAALILQSPYTSIAEAGQHHYWYMPVKWLIKDTFPAEKLIAKNRAPLLVLMAARDRVIPPALSRRLFETAPDPKTLKVLENVGHNDLSENGGLAEVLDFLKNLNAKNP